jgi:hypothetical protein
MADVSVIGFSISPDAHRSDLRLAAVDEQFDAGEILAEARPFPVVPPVMTATLPCNLPMILAAQRSAESFRTDRFIMSGEDTAVKRY